jgi:hypothetical protein
MTVISGSRRDQLAQIAYDAYNREIIKPGMQAPFHAVADALLAELGDEEAPHCASCTCGCTCGYGGLHEPENPRCELYDPSVTVPAQETT